MGKYWEIDENTMGTRKTPNTPTLPQKKEKKNLGTWVHAASPHWLQECFGPPIFLSFLA
jgi:hypothetical protein